MNELDPPLHVLAGTVDVARLACLRVAGADARSFLDAQLTRNVPPAGIASPAGYCSPKGRLLASFVAWSDDDGVGLLVAAELADAIAKRLRMYVLRSKVTITRLDDGTAIEGLVLADDEGLEVWQTRRIDGATLIRYPDADGRRRALRIGAPADGTRASVGIDAATWHWLDVRAGLPSIRTATQDRFVPQMVNLEALGGVDFRKGCFPGQEVVARSQYLGKLKRRTALGSLSGAANVPGAGLDVFEAGAADPVGMVVDAARGPDGRIAALVELPVASFSARDLRVGARDGEPLVLEALPYALPDNEVFVRPKL